MVAVRARAWGVAALESLVLLVYLAAMPSPRWWVCPACGLYAAANIALTLVVAVILTVMGRWRSIGFRAPRRRRDLLYFLVPFLPVILNVAPGLQFTGAAEVTGLLLFALMVGFVEDSSVPRSDAHRTAGTRCVAGDHRDLVLFGLTHLAIVLAGATVLETISQVAYTIAFGVVRSAGPEDGLGRGGSGRDGWRQPRDRPPGGGRTSVSRS
jgi:hypothetical protein